MSQKTMVDASVPNAGRIYDYLLGGHHNFEIDRQAGNQIEIMMPFLPKLMRLMRWCLQDVANELTYKRGFDTIIDFASGLPTQDHIHSAAAPDTTVIYSDRDPVCVEYAQEILGDTPNVHYFHADCRRPEDLLNRSEVRAILGNKRHVAFVYWGITMYLSDKDIAHAAHVLHDWSDGSSCLAFYLQPGSTESEDAAKTVEVYRQMGEELFFRNPKDFTKLVQPWVADGLGYRTMEQWHGLNVQMTEADRMFFPDGTSGYGVYMVK